MGNQISGSSVLSLTTLPADVMDRQEIKKYGIELGERHEKLISACFPIGWTIIKNGEYWTTYVDPDGFPRFSCFAKFCSYEKDAHTDFFSDDYAKKEHDKLIKSNSESQNISDAIKDLFVTEWSTSAKYIVYYYKDGTSRADSYMSGYPKDEKYKNCVIEFSRHIFIGYANNIQQYDTFINLLKHNEQFVNKLINDGGYNYVVIKKLYNGLKDLHRHEIRHMFKYDPCIKEDRYDSELDKYSYTENEQKKTQL